MQLLYLFISIGVNLHHLRSIHLYLCACDFQKEKNRKWLQSARWVPDRLSWLGWSRQVSRLGSRVGKCQIFYTDKYQQTRFYPEKSA